MKVFSLVLSVALVSSRPQLDLPGSQPARNFLNFPSRSGPSVQGELSRVSLLDDVSNGDGLLSVLNSRTSSSVPGVLSRTTASSASGDDGPPMPYSFNFNVADEESQVYHARQEESDGETVVGSYSYVDPTGALIIVNYRAGVMGYTETRERKDNYVQIRPVSSRTSSSSSSSSSKVTSGAGAGSSRFGSSTTGGAQQLTTTLKKKKTVDQNALIAKIIAALQPQLSSIVDESIGEFETVTEEKFVTVEKLPTITTSTFDFSEQQSQF